MARSGVDTLEISPQNLNNLHLTSRAVALVEPVVQTGLENPDIPGYLLDRLFPSDQYHDTAGGSLWEHAGFG